MVWIRVWRLYDGHCLVHIVVVVAICVAVTCIREAASCQLLFYVNWNRCTTHHIYYIYMYTQLAVVALRFRAKLNKNKSNLKQWHFFLLFQQRQSLNCFFFYTKTTIKYNMKLYPRRAENRVTSPKWLDDSQITSIFDELHTY